MLVDIGACHLYHLYISKRTSRVAQEAELSLHVGNSWTSGEYFVGQAYGGRKKTTETSLNTKVRPSYWHVRQNHLFYRSSNCRPPVHITWGEAKDPLWEEAFGLSCRAGSLFLIWVKVASGPHNRIHQPNCFLKLLIIHSQNPLAGGQIPQLGVSEKVIK